MIYSLFLSLFLFVPGILILVYIANKNAFKLNSLEYILFGSVLWNYIFISLSIIVGLFSNLLKEFYTIFSAFSFLIVGAGVILILSKVKKLGLTLSKTRIKAKLRLSIKNVKNILILYIIISFLIVDLLLANYHSIIYEWDAVYIYLPIAKSLVFSGHLSNVLKNLNFVEYSPAVPIFYSFIFYFSGNLEDLYVLSSIFFILSVLAILELAKKLGLGDVSFMVALIFLILPSTQIVIGSRFLYLDLPFLFYFIIGILLVIKTIEVDNKVMTEIFLLFDFVLLFLTRIEVSLFVLPTLFVAYFLPSKFGMKTDVFLVFLTLFSVPLLRDLRHLIFGGSITICRFVNIYTPYFLGFIIFLIIDAIVIKDSSSTVSLRRVRWKELLLKILIWSFALAPALIYLVLNNILRGGIIIPGFYVNPKYKELNDFLNQLYGTGNTGQQVCFPCGNFLVSLMSWWSFALFLSLILFGLLRAFYSCKLNKKISKRVAKFVWAYLGFLIFWMTINCDPQPRRMLYFTPLVSIVGSYGIALFTDWSWYFTNMLYLIILSLKVWNIYVSIAQVDNINTNIMHYVYPKTYIVDTIDYDTISFFSLIYFLILGIYFIIKKYKIRVILSSILMIMFLIVFYQHAVFPLLAEVSLNGNDSKMKLLWKTPYYPEVVDFFKNHSIINQKVLCFSEANELPTFTNNKFIALSPSLIYGFNILDKLKEKPSLDEFSSYLLSINVSYLLVPTEQAKSKPSIYFSYIVLYNKTVLGDLIKDRVRSEVIGRTTYFYVIRLHKNFTLFPLNYDSVIPWTYVPVQGYNLTITEDGIVFKGYPPENWALGVLFRFKDPLSLDRPIMIDLTWKGNISNVVVILFSDLSNRQTNYLRIFYFPGEKIVINKFIGKKVGAFDENHIEAIYVGLMPVTSDEFNESITLSIKGLYFILYDI
ncbi:MAG: hypothetical protein GU357_03570 [Thermofilum sp.]|jgi:hypothetical protein|nr:hypothetical protein [Thermofilum sp.]